ncbi:hypothetical protein QKU48_gp0187 [Fadolivirus algeromassiliense]|jgi:hypothetical protein|uniref:Uncharacterized protein n=1 Tax=Fadolivirus FV1/VV64 TaxID=3070911 RepID=A0A7D3QTV8_9VIRU|nr:hypothetical protein QKU48_gp0187 [Fadolivirus algeromassiliense]QKF93645.1 hypothetical protein Fadolivirus_1_187 [Fadolivirus FV1/VV64]
MKPNQYIVFDLFLFIEAFDKFIINKDTNYHNILKYDLNYNELSNWNNKDGKFSMILREIIKKYFKVKVAFFPWNVPYAACGVYIALESDDTNLFEIIITELNMKSDEYTITDQKGVEIIITSAIC